MSIQNWPEEKSAPVSLERLLLFCIHAARPLLLATCILALTFAAQPVAAQGPCPSRYEVKQGDSLSTIAGRCSLTRAALLEANTAVADSMWIYVGQVLVIPRPEIQAVEPETSEPRLSVSGESFPPGGQVTLNLSGFPADAEVEFGAGRQGEDLVSLGKAFTGSSGSLEIAITLPGAAADGETWLIGAAATGGVPAVALSAPFQVVVETTTYVVQRGDWLSRIARRFETSVAAILDYNSDIKNPHRIFVGQQIVIPPYGYRPSEAAIALAGMTPPPPVGKPANVDVEPDERWIDVNLTSQTVHAYEGEKVVRSFMVSTGRARTPTVTGQYRIYVKLDKTDMRGPGYHLRDVPHTMYFYKGYGLHGTYWHSNFGAPMSAGCVNLSLGDAEWLYNFAEVGTLVNVRY